MTDSRSTETKQTHGRGSGKILVVESDRNLAELYRLELEDEGYTVVTESNPASALDLAFRERPEIIMFDMGRRDAAREMAQCALSRPWGAATLAVFGHESDCDQALFWLADMVVRKSGNLDILKMAVSSLMASDRLAPKETASTVVTALPLVAHTAEPEL